MSNKQARRAAKTPAASQPAPTATPAASPAVVRSLRIRTSTSITIVGGLVAVLGAVLPWVNLPDGTSQSGLASPSGVGTLVLGLATAAIGLFILLRPDHPSARGAAWAGVVAVLGIGALGVIAVLNVDKASGASAAPGVLFAIAGGMVATMGLRGLLERR
jgi:hypothetical protein